MPKGNPKGKAPVAIETNPLQGMSSQSKIEFYHLEDKVITLKRAGCTLQEIQDTINTKYLTEPDQFISIMSISRFLSKHFDDYKTTDQRYANFSLNEYNELLDMLQYSESQLEVAEKTLSDIRKEAKDTGKYANAKDIVALMNATEKSLARRQSILSDIVGIKDKIYNFIAMQQIVSTVMQKVKDKDILLYAEIKNEFNNDAKVSEYFKKIPEVAEKLS